MDARNTVDLTNPGDVVVKSEKTFGNLPTKRNFMRAYYVQWMNLKLGFFQL